MHHGSGMSFAAVLVASIVTIVAPGHAASSDPGPGVEACGARCVLVHAIVARRQTFTPTVVLTGAIAPKFQTNVAFRVSGKIIKRSVEIGEHVAADEILAALDPRDQVSNLDTAKAGLASAQALLVQANVAFERQKSLFQSGYTTRPSFDDARQQLQIQEAAVDSAKAVLGTAQEQLGYAALKAGIAGIVVGRNAEAGQVVQAGQTVFVLAQDGPRDAVFDVYEALLTEPPADRTVKIALQSDPSVMTLGKVREISPTVDDKSGAVRVKVGLDDVPESMSLGAAVIGAGAFKPRAVIVLPRSALFRWNDSPAVWLLDKTNHTASPKVVTLDRYDGDRLVLTDGVEEGDMVVTAGIQFLHPGQTIGVAKPETTP